MTNKLLIVAFVVVQLLVGCHIYKVSNRSDEKVQMRIECTPHDSSKYVNNVFNKALSKNAIDSLTIRDSSYEFVIFPKRQFNPTKIISRFNDTAEVLILSIVKPNKVIDTIYISAKGKVQKNIFHKKSYITFMISEYLIK